MRKVSHHNQYFELKNAGLIQKLKLVNNSFSIIIIRINTLSTSKRYFNPVRGILMSNFISRIKGTQN